MAAGAAYQDHGLIFPTEIGTPLDPDNFSHTFSRLTFKAGLGHWHTHELRHSGALLMLAQGTDLYVVSEVLGHASIAITKDVYGHLVEGHQRSAAEAMSAALLGRLAPSLAPRTRESDPPRGKRTELPTAFPLIRSPSDLLRACRDSNPKPSDP